MCSLVLFHKGSWNFTSRLVRNIPNVYSMVDNEGKYLDVELISEALFESDASLC